MSIARSIIVNIIGRDNASGSFLRVSKAADRAANSADRAVLRMRAHSAKMQAVGQTMSRSITLPLLAIGAVSVDQAAKFQKSLAVLNTATGESVQNLGKVGDGIKKIAIETGTSLSQLNDGMYLAEKAGFSLAKGGLTVLKAAAQGAKAENVDLSTAMTALTSIMTSYGLSAKDAVKTENELIVGSGLAKTTMTDFANSLSNVVPIAAALGVSFPEVAGAIATMTQHGETAQRATENLANLLTNLAGSNNVATSAMQQLGINTVDLQQHLGRRGLAGTLNIVLNAMKKHGHAGLVVYDTFKKASLATLSMKQQLAGMTGLVKKNSQAFADGKIGYREYQKFFRSLGGKNYAQASQFAATVKSFMGFNNLVRQGRGDRQTYAKWLQQALGGITGLKTVLMLLGGNFDKTSKSAATFTDRTKAIAKAGKETGKDVHGWSVISKQAMQKFDVAREHLQVLSVNIGSKLLPYVAKAVSWVGKLADKFDGLSHTHKKILGWALLIIAALGPVMAIFGRLGRVIAGAFRIAVAVSRFRAGMALMNASLATTNTNAYRAGRRISTAMQGVGTQSQLMAGTATRSAAQVADAETAQTRAVIANSERQIAAIEEVRAAGSVPLVLSGGSSGVVGGGVPPVGKQPGRFGRFMGGSGGTALSMAASMGLMFGGMAVDNGKRGSFRHTAGRAMTGAGIGMMAGSFLPFVGGPLIGAGVGALIGGLTAGHGISVQQQRWNKAWTAAKAFNKLPAAYRNQMLKNPAFNKAMGLTPTGTAMEGGPGGKRVKTYTAPTPKELARAKAMVKVAFASANADRVAGAAGRAWSDAIVQTGHASKTTATDIASAALAHTDLAKAGKKVGLTQKDLTNAITGTNEQYTRTVAFWKQFGKPTAAQLSQLSKLRNAWKDSGKEAIKTAIAQGKTIASMKRSGTITDLLRGKLGQFNRAHLTGHRANQVYRNGLVDLDTALLSNGATLAQNSVFGQRNAVAIKKQAALALQHAQAVYQQTGSLKKSAAALAADRAQIEYVGKAAGLKKVDVDRLLASMGLIAKIHPKAKVSVDTATAKYDVDQIQSYIDSIHGHVVTMTIIRTTHANDSNPGTRGDNQTTVAAPPWAAGGVLRNGYFTVGERGWELGHKQGNKVTIFDNKKSKMMTGWNRVPGFAGGTKKKADQSTLSQSVSGSIGQIGQQYNSPFDLNQVGLPRLTSQIAAAISALKKAVDKGLKKSLADGFEKQIKRLAKLAEHQLAAIHLRIKKTDLADISKGLKDSVDAGKTAYDKLAADMKAAGASASQIARVRANESSALANDRKLLAAKDYRNSIKDTLKGAFDSTQYGSVQDLLTGFGGASATNNAYGKELTSLRGRAKGNKGLLAYINQLAASGQTTTLQTLYGANGGELNQVGKAVSSYNASLATGSDAAEITKFGTSVNALAANQDALAKALANVAKAFLKDSAKPTKLHLHINGKEIAAEIVHTKEFDKELGALLDSVVRHHTYRH